MNFFMRVYLTQVNPGDIVLRDIFNSFGVLIIAAGTVLKERDIDILMRNSIDMLEVYERVDSAYQVDALTLSLLQSQTASTPTPIPVSPDELIRDKELPSTLSPEVYQQFQAQYATAIQTTNQLFNHAYLLGTIDKQLIEDAITPLLDITRTERDVVSLLLQLNLDDDYTCQHSIQVSMLSYYIASWLGYSHEQALRVGKAGYLHDIGKCRIERSILNKPSRLTDAEYEIVKKHAQIGSDIISSTYTDEWFYIAAMQHHERTDGSGYPKGLQAPQIHHVAKIVSIADVYSAMISKRVYRDKRDMFTVLNEMYLMSYGKLDTDMTHTFIRKMLPNFLHKRVRLNDDRIGTIVMNHNSEFFRPLIQIDQHFVDLAVLRQLKIEEVYM